MTSKSPKKTTAAKPDAKGGSYKKEKQTREANPQSEKPQKGAIEEMIVKDKGGTAKSGKKKGKKKRKKQKKRKPRADAFSAEAMENAYYVCHNVADFLAFRGFKWTGGKKGKGKGGKKKRK